MSKKKEEQTADRAAEGKWEAFAKKEAETPDAVEADVGSDHAADESIVTPAGLDFPDHALLEKQLLEAEKQAEMYKDQAMRALAEMENLRRRVEKDVANARKFGSEKLLVDFLPVVDSLVRGLEAPESEDPQAKSMREGLELTLGLIEKTIEKHGVKPISPKEGEAFNPDRHEAMSMLPGSGAASNTVIQVLQKGYELNGRVLRAAMVIVAQ